MTLSRGLCCFGLSSHICTMGIGGSWSPFSRQPFPLASLHSPRSFSLSPSVALAVRPLWLPCLACPLSPHRLALLPSPSLSASLSHHPHLCLFFPVGLSLSPLSSVSLDPRSSQTWFTFRWLQRYFAPSLLPPRPRGPDCVGNCSCPWPISLLFLLLLVGQLV